MVAAFCDGADVLCMDPNYGEFWLPTRPAFNAWFRFLPQETYRRSYKSIIVRTWVAR